MAIGSFNDAGSEDIAHQRNTKAARKTLSPNLHRAAMEKLALLDAATRMDDLLVWPSLRLEKLKGDRRDQYRRDQYSIRINDRYRACFVWRGSDALNVEIVDYH